MCRATALPKPEAPPVTTARASVIFMRECPAGILERAQHNERGASGHFHRERGGFAAADAQRGDAATAAARAQRVHQRGHDACTGGTDRMAERAGAAVDVGACVVEPDVA